MSSACDRELERGRPARDGDAVARADEVGELALERGQILAEGARDLAGADGVERRRRASSSPMDGS